MKKTSAILLSSIMLGMTILSACGSGQSATQQPDPQQTASQQSASPALSEPVTLKYYNWDSEVTAVTTQKILDGFHAKHPNIKVEAISLVPGNSVETLKKLDVTMSSGEQVDVVVMPSIEETMARAAQGVFAPLDDFYKQNNVDPEADYYVNPQYNDKYYAVMNNANTWFVMFNMDALTEAGLTLPEMGWTWDDFREYAKKLTKGEGSNKQYGTYFHSWGEYANMIAYTDKQNPYVTADLTPQFNDSSFKTFFEMRRAMETEDKSAKSYADVIGAKLNYNSEFFSGQAAMLISATFILPSVADTAKYPHTFKTEFAPLPRPSKDADPGLTYIGGQYLSIANNSNHKEAAYELIRYLTTETDAKTDIPGYKKADGQALLERVYGEGKELIDLASLSNTLFDSRIKTAVSSDIAVSYGSQLKKVLEDGFSKFILDNVSAEEAQKQMMEEAEKIITQNTK